jgi:hypothetical protein
MTHAARQLRSWLIFDVGRCMLTLYSRRVEAKCSMRASKVIRTSLLFAKIRGCYAGDVLGRWRSRRVIRREVKSSRRLAIEMYKGGAKRRAGAFIREEAKAWDSRRRHRRIFTVMLSNPDKPNKAPEPTPTAVTPRALEMKIEMKTRNCDWNEARVVPAAGVAHL